jgi:thiol-disulfide isomerase/thioredoxin
MLAGAAVVSAGRGGAIAAGPAGRCALDRQQQSESTSTLARANDAFTAGRFDDALRFYKRANQLAGGKCAECLWGIAQIYNVQGAETAVIETCDQFLQVVGPDSKMQAAALNLKGVTAWNIGRRDGEPRKYDDAEASFRRALHLEPGMVVLHYNLGMIELVQGRDEEGLSELRTYLDKDPHGRYVAAARRLVEDPLRGRAGSAPDLSGTTPDGRHISIEDLRGTIIVVDFWASWCGQCKKDLPFVKDLVKKYAKSPFVVVGVSADTDVGKWRAAITDHTWPQMLDQFDAVGAAYSVLGYPTYVVIDGNGVIRLRTNDIARVEAAVQECLKAIGK